MTGRAWIVACVVVFFGAGALPFIDADDQQWTPEEASIWKLEQAYLDRLKAEDIDGLLEYWHPEGIGWPSHAAGPVGGTEASESLSSLLDTVEIEAITFEPLAIAIVGNVALVHYFAELEIGTGTNSKSKASYRMTHTWMIETGRWRIVGGMSAVDGVDTTD